MKVCNMRGSIESIETLGLLDGPGIRVVVFMSGCKLRCLYCHNPETWKMTNYNYTVDELVKKILRYKTYFNQNGGVTFSGGEPLLQSEFLYQVALKLKEHNINIALDTAGVGHKYDKLLDIVDLVIYDIKAVKPKEYTNITGYKIEESNEFIRQCNLKNKKMWLRSVIIPGINDTIEYIRNLKDFIKVFNNVEKIELLPYHKMGIKKYQELNIKYPLEDIDDMNIDECKKLENLLKED